MRLVLDTNVVISAFLWGGAPLLLLSAAHAERVELITSSNLIAELTIVLGYKKFERKLSSISRSASDIVDYYEQTSTLISPVHFPHLCKDPFDDNVLATASAGRVDMVVSGDRHLLSLKTFDNIPIVNTLHAVTRAGLLT